MDMLLSKPWSLVGVIISAGVSSVSIATLAWWNLVRSIIDFHVGILLNGFVWIIAFVSLPLRIFNALQREKTLDMHVRELQTQLESIVWENKELEERLHGAIKERKVIETALEEMDEEHEKALSKIDQLENELQDLKEENLRLKENQGKSPYDYKSRDDKFENILHEGIPLTKYYGVHSWSSDYKRGGITVQDVTMHDNIWSDAQKIKSHEQSTIKPNSLQAYRYTSHNLSSDAMMREILERRRVVALSRSLFSSVLSLIVGLIVWQSEDPCMPLVAALFCVVVMSLNSVLQFFSTIKNKPAFDAVALLSINWFILGTLSYPSLPGVARMLAPRAFRIVDRLVDWLGFSFSRV